jgi:hypothetical protein
MPRGHPLTTSLGSRASKREASAALAELTEDGIYPPSWVTSSSVLCLPLARSRLRRLPSDGAGQAVAYTADDRAAAVDEFLRSRAAIWATWHDNPPATWEKAKRLLADGHSRHDAIHRLVG